MSDDGASRVRRNAVYLFLGVVVTNIAAFGFRLILAREFGPSGFGVFSLALMTISIATMVALLGLPNGVTTFVSKFREREEYDRVAGVFVASLGLSLGASVVLSVAVVLLAPLLANRVFDSPALADILWWFALVVPANVFIDVSAAYFLGIERGGYRVFIKQLFPKLSLLLLMLGIALVDGPLVAVGIAYLVATGVAGVLGIAAVVRTFSQEQVSGLSVDVRELLTYSIPLLITSTLGLFLNWTDTIVVGAVHDSRSVGIYQTAFLLAGNIHIFLGAISGSLFPNFASSLASGDTETIRRRYIGGTRWAVLASVAPAVYLLSFSELSLGMLFGESFATGGIALKILVLGQIIIILFGPGTTFLKAIEESRYVAVTYGIAAISNVVLNVLLVPVVGIVGAALATSVALVSADLLHFRGVRHHVTVPIPLDTFARASVAGIIASLGSGYFVRFVVSISLFGAHIVLFSTVYVIVLYVVGGFEREEVEAVLIRHDFTRHLVEKKP